MRSNCNALSSWKKRSEGLFENIYKGLEFLSVSKQQGQVRSAVSWDVIIQYYAERLTVGVRVIFDKIS